MLKVSFSQFVRMVYHMCMMKRGETDKQSSIRSSPSIRSHTHTHRQPHTALGLRALVFAGVHSTGLCRCPQHWGAGLCRCPQHWSLQVSTALGLRAVLFGDVLLQTFSA